MNEEIRNEEVTTNKKSRIGLGLLLGGILGAGATVLAAKAMKKNRPAEDDIEFVDVEEAFNETFDDVDLDN